MWIGLSGTSSGSLEWGDGTPATFISMDDNYPPVNSMSGCYRVVPPGYNVAQDTWHDDDCTEYNGYICEYEGKSCH